MTVHRPTIVAVSGFSSNVGKTTLVCKLLEQLPGWEAIKLTRGHYRSCGRDPEACCVSDLLEDKAVVRSGRDSNYESGKDTGRFWDAGATNVHWVIVSDDQVEQGIAEALSRVKAEGVVIEGNSFLQYVEADMTIMCSRSEGGKIKNSARETLSKSDLLYLSSVNGQGANARLEFETWRASLAIDLDLDQLPLVTAQDLPQLIESIKNKSHRLQPAL
jgi:molybdopterin-guanine dinucleotide biosynthesis protein